MARQTGSQRRTATKRDPIAELTARIAKIRASLKSSGTRGKSAQQNSLRVLEKRLANYKTNKAQFGNVYGQRGGGGSTGRSTQKNKEKASKLKIKKRMNTDSGESEEQEWGPKGQPSASSQVAKTDKKVTKKTDKKNTNEKLKVNKTEKKTESSSSSNDSDRAAWLKKTRNSPAAKAGLSDDQRWEAQKRHREWKKKRKK